MIHDEMSEAALILAESAGLPYIQTVADFRTLGRGIAAEPVMVSSVVAIRPDLAAGLVDELGVPESLRVGHPAGDRAGPEPPPRVGPGRVPVIGTGGPLDEVSGLMVFLEAAAASWTRAAMPSS